VEWTLSPVGVRLWVGLGSFGRLWVVLKLLAGTKVVGHARGSDPRARRQAASTISLRRLLASRVIRASGARHEHELLINRCCYGRAWWRLLVRRVVGRSGGGSLRVTQLVQCWGLAWLSDYCWAGQEK